MVWFWKIFSCLNKCVIKGVSTVGDVLPLSNSVHSPTEISTNEIYTNETVYEENVC